MAERRELPECFQHRFLNSPWGERHRRALAYLAQREYASVRDIGFAASNGLRTDGQPLNSLGAGKHGGRIANDLSRLGFVTPFKPYRDARGYYRASREGLALIAKGELRYAVERRNA